jgi:hypothetical protein
MEKMLDGDADAAFVGRAISHERSDAPGGGFLSGVLYTFEVETVVKGDLGGQVEVYSSGSGASCGFEFEAAEGKRSGIFLTLHEDGTYRGGLCTTTDPDLLLNAAQALPAPDGVGPPKFLVGGDFHRARMFALDASGRTLAYETGPGPTLAIAACPGSERAVEVYGPPEDLRAGVRDLASFDIVAETRLTNGSGELPAGWDVSMAALTFDSRRAVSLTCLDPSGSDFILYWAPWEEDGDPAIVRVQPGSDPAFRVLWHDRADLSAVSPLGEAAYVITSSVPGIETADRSYSIKRVDLSTGDVSEVATLPQREDEVAVSSQVSPDGRRLAAVFVQEGRPWEARAALFDLDASPATVIERPLEDANRSTRLIWIDNDQLLLTFSDDESQFRVLDQSLAETGRTNGAASIQSHAVSGGAAHGFTVGPFATISLTTISLTTGETAQRGKYLLSDNPVFAVLPGQDVFPAIDADVRSPATATGQPVTVIEATPSSRVQSPSIDGPGSSEGVKPVILWSAISLGGLAALVVGYASLRMFILRRRESIDR